MSFESSASGWYDDIVRKKQQVNDTLTKNKGKMKHVKRYDIIDDMIIHRIFARKVDPDGNIRIKAIVRRRGGQLFSFGRMHKQVCIICHKDGRMEVTSDSHFDGSMSNGYVD